MSCDQLRTELKRLKRKVTGSKAELCQRLLEPCQKNDRGWARNWEEQLDGSETFLAEGEFRYVYTDTYEKGPRKGEKAVWKIFKDGATFESKFFDQDLKAVDKASEFISEFNDLKNINVNSASATDFDIGNRVQWESSDADVPSGAVGKVIGHKGRKVRVKFPRGSWKFRPSKLKHSAVSNFKIGSLVQWTGQDSDVPRGAVGKVIGFTTDRVKARFPKGCWDFMPSELKKASAPAAKRIYINKPEVWTQHSTGKKGLVEPFLGAAFTKFNSNSGWTNGHPLMQALSHFSYHQSEGKYLLCDLQGKANEDSYILTDPVVLSRTSEFSSTDGGNRAMQQFFAHHKCGAFCDPKWIRIAAPSTSFPIRSSTTFFNR